MEDLIDFSGSQELLNEYGGAGKKVMVVFDDDVYMLKFGHVLEPDPKKPLQASYESSPVSEHLGSQIYDICGVEAQETLLGTYHGRSVVACKDFVKARTDGENLGLIEFKKLENSFVGSSSKNERTPSFETITETLSEHPGLSGIREIAEEHYWKMFVIDSLIGNFDRHSGNWGYIVNRDDNRLVDVAPVYDCGSSFYPRMGRETMRQLAASPDKMRERIEAFPYAALKVNGKKVHYHEFLVSENGRDARSVLHAIFPRVELSRISNLIWSIPGISNVQREFYEAMVESRYENILKPAYNLACRELKYAPTRSFEYSHLPDPPAPLNPAEDIAQLKDMARANRKPGSYSHQKKPGLNI